ncbi:MAG: thymidylate kinase [Candidatus Parcubacteria bacterium]|nr:thymidylate kinase [Candidatus Parcubacteria bacterium]
MKNKLIVLEGGDGSGKATQSKLLLSFLEKSGTVSYFDFPQYRKTVFGDLTGRCLAGDFGDFVHMSPYLSSLPYMLDRACAKEAIISALEKGNVVCNRYTTSNIGFQAGKLQGKEREDMINFLEKGEYEELGLPRPDVVIYLDVPRDVASALVLKKEKRDYLGEEGIKDQHEKDMPYQEKVAEVYRSLSEERENWHIVSCSENGMILSPETIREKIAEVLKKYNL